MSDLRIYQNKGGDIRWDGKQSARYDSEREPSGCVKRFEFLRDDDPRYLRVAGDRTIELVDKMPSGEDIEELQAFILRRNFKPEWIAGWMERLLAESALAETERKAKEEATARLEEIADRKATRAAVEKIANPSNPKSTGVDIPEDVGPDYFDPKVKAIRDSGRPGKDVPEKLTALYLLNTKYRNFSKVAQAKLIGVSPDAVRNALLRMRDKADALKKKGEIGK